MCGYLSSPLANKDEMEEEAAGEEDEDDGPHKKMTRAMHLRHKKLKETQAREAASTTKEGQNTVYFQETKRRDSKLQGCPTNQW